MKRLALIRFIALVKKKRGFLNDVPDFVTPALSDSALIERRGEIEGERQRGEVEGRDERTD